MLEALREAIETLEVPVSAGGLVAGFELLGRLHAHLAEASYRFAQSGDWMLDGAFSPKAWLHAHARLECGVAARVLRHGKRLDQLPVTLTAAKTGVLSVDQAVAITSNLTDTTIELFAALETELVPTLAALTVTHTAQAMRYWKANAAAAAPNDDGGDGGGGPDRVPDMADERCGVYLSQHFEGNWALNGDLTSGAGQVIDDALSVATTVDAGGVERTLGQRRADALEHVARYYLAHHGTPVPVVNRPGAVIIVTLDQLTGHDPTAGLTVTGQPLTRAQLDRITCDCTIHRNLVVAAGATLDFGYATRSISPALRFAVATRDRHCRFPNCDRPPDECDVHHIIHWANGGTTALINLALGCFSHHHLFHHPDWNVTGNANEISITTPPALASSADHHHTTHSHHNSNSKCHRTRHSAPRHPTMGHPAVRDPAPRCPTTRNPIRWATIAR